MQVHEYLRNLFPVQYILEECSKEVEVLDFREKETDRYRDRDRDRHRGSEIEKRQDRNRNRKKTGK